jgi:hypothetical protein
MTVKITKQNLEAWFDGHLPADAVQEDALTPDLKAHLALLRSLRGGVEAAHESREISDAQLPAFLAGIREQAQGEPVAARWPGLWAYASVATAAVVVALSALFVVVGGPEEVKAQSEVQTYSSELEGATIDAYTSDNGTAVVWINAPEADVW